MNELNLVHGTEEIQNVISILNMGIVRPRDLNLRQNFSCSDKNHIYFAGIAIEDITPEQAWGQFQFVLNNLYVKANRKQFGVHATFDKTYPEMEEFRQFIRKMGFKKHRGKDAKVMRQVISTKPIGVDGLEAIIVPSSSFQEKEGSRIIRAVPRHMHLYVSDNKKVARIR